ncbi:MFS transporter [Jonesiaceae bacterium BS-20]|uniref:MFS transporter n=1 Tax=Jonesiaceae bacterium BS-20 TaxID=3120821 RepID=A0AAU7DTF0_9MICO
MTQPQAKMAKVPVPTERASTGWILRFTLAYIGINIVWAGPGQVLMAPQVEILSQGAQWGPFTTVKEDNLALIGAIAGIFAVLSGPLWGALSDRSSSKWGRRTPWMTVGTILVAIAMVASGMAQTLPALLLSWTAFQIVINAVITPLSATIPDHVPERQRGVVSGWYGFGYTFAVVAGTGLGTLATALWPGMKGITLGYFLCAAACVVAMLPMLANRWETPLPREVKESIPKFGWPQLLACFWVDVRKHPDFGWAWLTRFIVTLSTSTTLFYLYYYLQDEIGLTRDDALVAHGLRVSEGVLLLTATYAIAVFGTVVVAGVLSDRLGKRKVFVSAASIFIGIATVTIAFAPNFAVVIVGAIILGLGTGVFTSVDFAMVSQVLPATEDTGKDVGIIHLAITLPNILAPVVAALLVGSLGGYTSLYLFAGSLAVLGGLLVYKIKGVD